VFGVSDTGYVKSANEDHFSIIPPDFPGLPHLIALSDGVGGRRGGQLASVKALQVIGNRIFSNTPSTNDAPKMLFESFNKANDILRKLSDRNESLKGMGTTAVVALVYDDKTVICSIGDSRAYAVTSSSIMQITKDHTWTNELREKGLLTDKQVKNNPYRHHLIKALGVDESANPETFTLDNDDVQWLLLCSDGLTEHVSDIEILGTVLKENDPKAAANKLLQVALSRGGTDNITIVIAKYEKID
ncbi:MAG: serine/threonine-protein phosphatase, partial [Caldiserica bacterium]|nr:serine/threonine-protein phosphatase [Caldisericota bacterium]